MLRWLASPVAAAPETEGYHSGDGRARRADANFWLQVSNRSILGI
jgi:hypothetical protein